ncbi:hypothetical protein CXF81_05340 [Glaciecola sp. 33A]|nr:hypothetical protein CXF81_05340 [Glaciecola sp. 33A]
MKNKRTINNYKNFIYVKKLDFGIISLPKGNAFRKKVLTVTEGFRMRLNRIGKIRDNFRTKIFCRTELHQQRSQGKGTCTWSVACLAIAGK